MAATLKIITSKVGEGGQKHGPDVRRVLQLLSRAGFLASKDDKLWTNAATQACKAFHRSIGFAERTSFDPTEKSDALLELCKKAKVVLPLKLGARGYEAFSAFWAEAVKLNVPYCWGGIPGCIPDRVAYGLDGYQHYQVLNLGGKGPPYFPDAGEPGVGMNCISFVNLALSIWRTGSAHAAPYDCSQAAGGFEPISARYGMAGISCPSSDPMSLWDLRGPLGLSGSGTYVPSPLQVSQVRAPVRIALGSPAAKVVNDYFYSSDEVLRVANQGSLYYVQWCYASEVTKNAKTLAGGFGHHDTVLYDGDVYEINVGTPALRRNPLGWRMNRGLAKTDALRVYGPV